jgi:hypothetical protein
VKKHSTPITLRRYLKKPRLDRTPRFLFYFKRLHIKRSAVKNNTPISIQIKFKILMHSNFAEVLLFGVPKASYTSILLKKARLKSQIVGTGVLDCPFETEPYSQNVILLKFFCLESIYQVQLYALQFC